MLKKSVESWRNRPDIKRITNTYSGWITTGNPKILELGPLDKPLLCKNKHKVKYADNFDSVTLKEKIKDNKNRNPDAVVHLDYVLEGKQLSEVVHEKFDVIVASHVLEHLPNLFGWLRDTKNILNENGKIFAVVPDKRYSFDLERPATSLGELIENDLLNRTKPSMRSAFDQRFYHKNVSSHKLWENYNLHKSETKNTFEFDQAMMLMKQAQEIYIDCHCNLLEPYIFREYIEVSRSLGLHNFFLKEIKITTSPFLDFIVLLEYQ